MTDVAVRLRPLTEGDGDALRAATLMNVNWTGEARFTMDDVLGLPDLAHYVDVVLDRGDLGVVAELDRPGTEPEIVGLVWLVFLGADDPGYGWVADGVPELSVTVWPGHRGTGLGRRLISAALDEARDRGIAAVSLSVEAPNPSVHLYRALGFVDVPDADEGTMLAHLHP